MGRQVDKDDQIKAENSVACHGIAVSDYKQILFLPLRLEHDSNPGKAVQRDHAESRGASQQNCRVGSEKADHKLQKKKINEQAAALAKDKIWQSVRNPLSANRLQEGGGAKFDRFSYQEFVYFHKFIQDQLFPRLSETQTDAECRIFSRKGLNSIKLELQDNFTYTLCIKRLWLYLFDIGVAVAMIEVQGKEAVQTLDDALRIQNALRRTYPPYFSIADMYGAGQPWDDSREVREYPLSVTLDGEGLSPQVIVTRPCQFEDKVFAEGLTPFAEHWQQLIAPLSVAGSMAAPMSGDEPAPVSWAQTVDERLPSMTFISTPDISRIGYHDWVRLGSMDNPDSGRAYGEAFLKEHFDRQHFYDRHWYAEADSGDLYKAFDTLLPGAAKRGMRPPVPAAYGTRYLITGYGFVCVGGSGDYFDKLISHHFSRIYASMGMLLHFQHATLLSLSNELSELAQNALELPEHQGRMIDLQERFNIFVQRYWFTNVSNQLQAKEMYEQWRAALGLEKLYQEVLDQVKDAAAFLDVRLQQQQAESALRLNQMAALGLPVALSSGLLGMNLIISDKFFPATLFDNIRWHIFLACLIFGLVFTVSHRIYSTLTAKRASGDDRRIAGWLTCASISFLAVAIAAFGSLVINKDEGYYYAIVLGFAALWIVFVCRSRK